MVSSGTERVDMVVVVGGGGDKGSLSPLVYVHVRAGCKGICKAPSIPFIVHDAGIRVNVKRGLLHSGSASCVST